MNGEFSTLLADIKEQILYLQELGAESFNVELSEFDASKFGTQNAAIKNHNKQSAISQEKLERFVPTDFELPKIETAKPKISGSEGISSRRSLLESTKLSRLPSLPKRNSFAAKITDEPASESKMPKTIVTEETPGLFGDVKPTLPEAGETIEDIRLDIGNCTRCPLHEGRTKIVHSTGNLRADLMFVGEAPGADEDAQGVPFVGRSGQLLNKIIESIGLKREDVFVGNINRCRPPGNRAPTLPEAKTCKPFLLREIAVVRPKVIVVLGNTACQNLLETKVGISKLRGEFQDYFGVKVMPTFHPAYLLRDPSKKREVWEDMKKVRDELNKLQG
ncbi:MAG: uracil-DNA glycosylase [Pyrinomonadaceae bacterium]|nr:uracil-DNA glycosylase [Pyrinomonadaceae bacterium]